jgi:diguanylate cyclase (GGDEF)-like protein/PAS domain S-box-containing protein
VEVEAHAGPRREAASSTWPPLARSSYDDGCGDVAPFGIAQTELTDAAHDAFVFFDSVGFIETWNTVASRMFGYGPEETLGRPTSMLMPEAQASAQDARIERVLEGERIHGINVEGQRRDGVVVPLRMTLVPAGEGRGGCVIIRDLTEEYLAQETLTEAEFRLREAQELSHVGLWLWDAKTDSLQISDELYRIHGIRPLEFEGTMSALMAYTHPEDRATLLSALGTSLESGENYEQEYRITRLDGSIGWIYSRAQVVTGGDGAAAGLRGVAQDVTDRKRAAESLREQASLLELLRRMAVAANEAADLEQALQVCMREVSLHTGWPVGQVLFIETDGSPLRWTTHTADPKRFRVAVEASQLQSSVLSRPIATVLQSGRPLISPAEGPDADDASRAAAASGLDTAVVFPLVVGTQVVAVLRFFGQGTPNDQLMTTVWDGANQLGRVVERARSRDELSHQALHDSLTGLPNRSLLMDRLGHALARQARGQSQIALIFLDLDNFKLINDSLGHETGDDLVVKVARRLERVLRPEDTAARFGGDEFIVLCDRLESEQEALHVAQRVLDAVSEPMSLRGHRNTVVTASAGIAIASGAGITPDALLRDADLAMYRAKEAGRGRYQIFDSEMHRRATQRLSIANELRTAIGEGQLRLRYQPQVDTVSGQLLGVEALIRWQHPERGLIGPQDFIPVAEETHLIVAVGEWVLNEACRQGAEWRDQYPAMTPISLCVNVSPKQLARPELIHDVAAALARSGLTPSTLCIEITESVLMSDAESFLQTLIGLKALGVSIAIDDFGTGYSSLAYLRRYPIDVIKVDKGFLDGVDGPDPIPVAVMAAVINLAHALGVVAVAEGVETQSQRSALQALGCDECQGFFFSFPLEAEAITALLGGSGHLDPESRH